MTRRLEVVAGGADLLVIAQWACWVPTSASARGEGRSARTLLDTGTLESHWPKWMSPHRAGVELTGPPFFGPVPPDVDGFFVFEDCRCSPWRGNVSLPVWPLMKARSSRAAARR